MRGSPPEDMNGDGDGDFETQRVVTGEIALPFALLPAKIALLRGVEEASISAWRCGRHVGGDGIYR